MRPPGVAPLRRLGASHLIDYTTADFSTSGRTYDVIFVMVPDVPTRLVSMPSNPTEEELLALKEMIEAGTIVSIVDRVCPDVVQALRTALRRCVRS